MRPSSHLDPEPVESPELEWSADDDRAVAYLRAIAADAVQRVGNGHPGTAMTLAPVAYLLFQKVMRHDPHDPSWLGRDRFVLSGGHTSLTLYSQLFLSDYGLTLADLESFRTAGSRTPGHPEHGHTAGVEATTGPLGQGLSMAVGMAMAARYERGLLDPSAARDDSPFDHRIWAIAGDGDLEEGITSEASSLAGLQKLNELCVIYDDNHISIEGDTALAFDEDVCERYRAYGWATHRVDQLPDGSVDVAGLFEAIGKAKAERSRPTLIQLRTTIAWPAPHARNTAKAHGSALGADEVRATKEILGLNPDEDFAFDTDLLDRLRQRLRARVDDVRRSWNAAFTEWSLNNPDRAALLTRLVQRDVPSDLDAAVPVFDAPSVSTRKASGEVINALARVMPELWGGSADLAESNNTTIEGAASFLPPGNPTGQGSPYGRVVHYGVREHAMGAIMNGIALHGLTRPFGGTFLVFSDYMRGAVRLSALMKTPVTYVWTHDSIGLGEDGPTHQPIEHLWSLRAMPDLAVVRPADANETAAAWRATLRQHGPVGLVLTRQNVPTLDLPVSEVWAGVARGGYVVRDSDNASVLLLATGSEVQLALAAAEVLEAEGTGTRVISLPCLEWFDQQDASYRDAVIPPSVTARVAVEAGATLGWWRFVGTSGRVVGIDHFGASADPAILFRDAGITVDDIVRQARATLAASQRD
ncbi:MAG: transketolase [Candidatus Nanopelagicales bacterium]|nr:transketolase [Candidatus Nanopelagicales bacterium]MCF8536600.1 transketolase [Candidatus Nanopelagicales bacterium]MCF8541633.1 transketolase [Candidatus Nanopelagicales bacterium]MCF8556267.1 transketolase [Candidatus Nanopelagicales bacterium]